jgi:hypothetical protein
LSYGLGNPTHLVRGEEQGLAPTSVRSIGDLMVLAIGQGPLTVTPLQVAVAFASIAIGSEAEWLDVGGSPVPSRTPQDSNTLLEPVRAGLERAVREGTARKAFEGIALDRVTIAGKTGSAEVGDATPYGWFAAYAGAGRPRYVVAVVVERGRIGGISAAPIVRRILDGIMTLPREPPPFPFPPPAVALLAIPLLAAWASPAAGSIAGLAAGPIAAAAAGGSIAAHTLAFALAGWLAAMLRTRAWPPAAFAVAGAVGTLAFPATERPVWWVVARAALVAVAALTAAAGARRLR